MTPTVPVTAVLVSHDGERWLPEVLLAVQKQTVRPTHLVGVDAGSTDSSADLLREACRTVLVVRADAGYGAAVAQGLKAVPASEWVWLLHDDAVPDQDALQRLLEDAHGGALRGPKVLDWADPRVLVELGLTVDGAGRTVTGLEPGELDQGQHDGRGEVLAVGTAGALIRRDAWDALEGLDLALPFYRDDLDLGWRANAAGYKVTVVPSARVRHVRASTTGERQGRAVSGRPTAIDRRHMAYVLLAHASGLRLPVVLLRLLVTALVRALWLVLRRQPVPAVAELAVFGVLTRPTWLSVARRVRRTQRKTPRSALRKLFPAPAARIRAAIVTAVERVAVGRAPVRRLVRQPVALLAVGLTALTMLAARDLIGPGLLAGGRLLPAPDRAGALLSAYAQGAPPDTAVLGLLGGLLFGQAPLAVEALLLGSVPAAGAAAWFAAGRVVRRPVLRLWAALTWALLPVATGAVAAGRLDAALVQILLPVGLLAGYAVVTTDPRRRWNQAWALGLGLAVVVAFLPLLWPVAVVLLAAGVLLTARPAVRLRLLAAAIVAFVPLVLLQPWASGLLADPAALLHGPGRLAPGLAQPNLSGWRLALLSPGGPGLPAVGVTLGLVLAALGALLGRDRSRTVNLGGALAAGGLAAALGLSRIQVDGGPVWPGLLVQLASAGLLLAALIGADGLSDRLQRSTFGVRQLTAVLVVVAAALTPVLCAASWVWRGAQGPLIRAEGLVLPAFAAAELADGSRALVLAPQSDGVVAYAVTGPDGLRLGDPAPPAWDEVVADLVSARGSQAPQLLAARSVRFVALEGSDATIDAGIAAALDTQQGLLRPGPGLLWRVLDAKPPTTEPRDTDVPVLQISALLVVLVLAGPVAARRGGVA